MMDSASQRRFEALTARARAESARGRCEELKRELANQRGWPDSPTPTFEKLNCEK